MCFTCNCKDNAFLKKTKKTSEHKMLLNQLKGKKKCTSGHENDMKQINMYKRSVMMLPYKENLFNV